MMIHTPCQLQEVSQLHSFFLGRAVQLVIWQVSCVTKGNANLFPFAGGQGFVIKLRETKEKSPSSMLLEPPFHINTSFPNRDLPFRWRHMKCVWFFLLAK